MTPNATAVVVGIAEDMARCGDQVKSVQVNGLYTSASLLEMGFTQMELVADERVYSLNFYGWSHDGSGLGYSRLKQEVTGYLRTDANGILQPVTIVTLDKSQHGQCTHLE